MTSVAVIGGGILGLETARRCAALGDQVTVFEAGDIGGLVASHEVGGHQVDRAYHVILGTDTRTCALMEALGLTNELQWGATRTGVWAKGTVHSVSNAAEYLRYPGLGPISKARLAATILIGGRIRNGRAMEAQRLDSWLIKWSGRTTFDRFWLPLLRAKTGDAWRRMSAAFIWATFQRLLKARSAKLGAEQFGFVRGGYARVLDAMRSTLLDQGVVLRDHCAVISVRHDGASLVVATGDAPNTGERFDQVICAVAPAIVGRIADGLTDDESRRFSGIDQVGVICATVVLRRKLTDFYLSYLMDADVPFTAVVEWTALAGSTGYGGDHIVYLPRYCEASDERYGWTDDAISAEFTAALRSLHPSLTSTDIKAVAITRAKEVYAVPTLGFSDSMPPITTSIAGLYAVSAGNLAYATLNVDDTLSLVDDVLHHRTRQAPVGAAR
jgi:protoporphyrinogen oxidase